jgi:hypothetical protein
VFPVPIVDTSPINDLYASSGQVTEVKEQAERRIAKLHAALQTADSRNRQLAADAVNAAPLASLTDQKVVALPSITLIGVLHPTVLR